MKFILYLLLLKHYVLTFPYFTTGLHIYTSRDCSHRSWFRVLDGEEICNLKGWKCGWWCSTVCQMGNAHYCIHLYFTGKTPVHVNSIAWYQTKRRFLKLLECLKIKELLYSCCILLTCSILHFHMNISSTHCNHAHIYKHTKFTNSQWIPSFWCMDI